jgi:hypothetical protein
MATSTTLIDHAATQILDLRKSVSWRQYEFWTRRYRNAVERKVRGFFLQQQREIMANINAGKSIKGPNQWLDMVKWRLIFEEYGQLFLPEVVGDKGQIEMWRIRKSQHLSATEHSVSHSIPMQEHRRRSRLHSQKH